MNMENIAGTAATGLLVFLGVVVAPQLPSWDATTSLAVATAAVVLAAVGAAVLARLVPAPAQARHLEYDAAWDHALAELTAQDVA